MIGFTAGRSVLHRAHPYTPLAVAAGVFLLAFAVRVARRRCGRSWRPPRCSRRRAACWAPCCVRRRCSRSRPGRCSPSSTACWAARRTSPWGRSLFSAPGTARALVFGGRLAAILLAFLTALATVSPARLVEAMTARGVPFGRTYLLVSTLTVLPRLRERAARIVEAQQCRGLALGGSPVARVRALGPLVVPLVLSALAEVDEQALALDVRGGTTTGAAHGDGAARRPRRSTGWCAGRWCAAVLAAYAGLFLGGGRRERAPRGARGRRRFTYPGRPEPALHDVTRGARGRHRHRRDGRRWGRAARRCCSWRAGSRRGSRAARSPASRRLGTASVGIVFATPWTQLSGLATTVRAEVAFGPASIGMPRDAVAAAVERGDGRRSA